MLNINSSDKVLVTGGAGFIGSHTVERLLACGCWVRVLDNLSEGKWENLPQDHPRLELIVGDIAQIDDVNAAMQGMDRCIHLAAQVSVDRSIQDPSFSCWQNILGFVHILDAAVRYDIKRLVYASSAAVYGNPKTLPVDELQQLSPLSPYGLEKKVGELYADMYQGLHGLASFGVRYFNVYGPRQSSSSPYSGVISIFVSRMQQGKGVTIYGDGHQSRDFIYVGDVARVNVQALFSTSTGVCNVATGTSITLLKLVDILSAFSSGAKEITFEPVRNGDIHNSLADVGLMQKTLHLSASVFPEEGLRMLWDSTLPL